MSAKKHEPPETAIRVLSWFCNPIYLEDILGDLEEEYEIVNEEGDVKFVNLWFYVQIFLLMRLSLIRPLKPIIFIENQITMFRNHIKIGLRNLWKYKSGTVINLVGLSSGIAAFILITLFVIDELGYDKNHENAVNIYRITVKNFNTQGELSRHWAFSSAGHAPLIKDYYKEVTHATRFYPWAFPDITVEDKKFPGEQVVFTDPDVFDIFTFPFIVGDPASALTNPMSIVLTEASAIRLFGNDWKQLDLIGKPIYMEAGDNKVSVNITGVMEDMPDQQAFHFDYLAPWIMYEGVAGKETVSNITGNYNYMSFVKVVPNTKVEDLNAPSDDFFDKYIEPFSVGKASLFYKLDFQPLLDIHLKSNLAGEIETNGDIKRVYIFSIVGVLLLIIACINYMNLATSRYSRRMKEIGVRKAVGASKGSLVSQFMTESLLLTFIAVPIALVLMYASLPHLNEFIDKNLSFNLLENMQLVLSLLALIVIIGFVAGLYPSLYLSSMKILNALKGESAMKYQKVNFRSILVTFQYMVAVGLIFALLVVGEQLKFVFNSDPGYDKEQILSLRLTSAAGDNLEVFKNKLLSSSNIEMVSAASRIPTGRLNDSMGASIYKTDSAENINFRLPYIYIDEYFIKTFGIDIIAGQDFDSNMKSDSTWYIILNRAATVAMGFSDPAYAIGQRLQYGGRDGKVYGISEDYHFESIHSEIAPMIMLKKSNRFRRLNIKLAPNNVEETIAFIEEEWNVIDPVNPINYRFVDEYFESQYIAEKKLGQVFKVFAFIAILISCLGMLGMVSFIIERKFKEIGIRKVLGASTFSVVWLIGKYFSYLIAISSIIAIPIGIWLMKGWLQDFAYQINIGIFLMLAPIAIIAILSTLTILYSTIKASLVNPVECLRDD